MFILLEGKNGTIYLNVAQVTHVEFLQIDLSRSYVQIYVNGWKEPIRINGNEPAYATIETWCKALTNR